MSYAPSFGPLKGLTEIHSRGKFHQYSICGCEVIYFKGFRSSRKYNFWLLVGGFSLITPTNQIQFVQKFHQ